MPAERLHRRTSAPVQLAVTRDPKSATRFIGPTGIAFITVAAILTLRSLPTLAEYGWASIAYYVIGAMFFFVPLAFVAAELATGWPRAGGMFAWVKQGFGQRLGFLAVWFDWIENVVWFPTVLSFVAATLAYIFDPKLANNRLYLVIVMLVVFWGLTIANFFGLKKMLRFNNISVVAGTLFPAVVLIALGIYWLFSGKTNAIPFHAHLLIPKIKNVNDVVFFAGVLLGFAGVEMAGFHAKETRNVKKDYPRAVFMATALILGISIFATLAIAFVVPQNKLSLVSGLMQAFQDFFIKIGLGSWATKVMAALVGFGTLAVISTWMLGPSEGVYAAEEGGDLPPVLHYVNKRHIPVAMLIFQGALGTLFALAFLFMPSVNTSYWMLTALTTQLTVMMYILMLTAAIRLRYSQPNVERAYRVPGGKYWGMWIVAGMGILGSVLGFLIGFVPPSGVSHWSTPIYVLAMFVGIVLCSIPPFLADIFKKPNWKITHPDPVLLDIDEVEGTATSGAVATSGAPTPVATVA